MRARLARLWEAVRVNFWLLPVLLVLIAAGLSFGMLAADRALGARWPTQSRWVFSGGTEGARAVLSSIASSMITVAGVVFSITVVSLTLASSQFGPRLLRAFIRDRGTQAVLGTFVATFLYCLLVLRTIRSEDSDLFVPHLSVTAAVGLAVLSIGVLIYYIHHVSQMIQAARVIAAVGQDLEDTLALLRRGRRPERPSPPRPACAPDAWPVCAQSWGYIESIDCAALLRLAEHRGLVVHSQQRAGRFIISGQLLALIEGPGASEHPLHKAILRAFVLRPTRTLAQDIDFAFEQLVEVAVRALSPGINDPFTAMQCVDRLTVVLAEVLRGGLPDPTLVDGRGRPRVVQSIPTFAELLDTSFDMIRRSGARQLAVLIRLLDVLAALALGAHREEDRAALRRHADGVLRAAAAARLPAEDLAEVTRRHGQALRAACSKPWAAG